MDQIYKQVISLRHRCNDYTDDPSASISNSLQNEVQKLEDEIQMNKNPKTIEGRAKSVVRMLEQAGDSGAMSHNHADELADQFEQIIQQLRKM